MRIFLVDFNPQTSENDFDLFENQTPSKLNGFVNKNSVKMGL